MTNLPDIVQSTMVIMPSILDKLIFLSYPFAQDKKMDKITLKNRLKVARAEKDLSQEELAVIAGVTRQTISSIETGQYCPSAFLAFLLAKKLEKPVEELFFLEGDK